MDYVELGRTGIQVSRCCLGTMTWGSQNSEAEAHEQMDYALEQGVTFWDTLAGRQLLTQAADVASTRCASGSRSMPRHRGSTAGSIVTAK